MQRSKSALVVVSILAVVAAVLTVTMSRSADSFLPAVHPPLQDRTQPPVTPQHSSGAPDTLASSRVAQAGPPAFAIVPPMRGRLFDYNTESYDRITDNQWTEVAKKPLSTFSTEVDTASYSNVRRFLNQGQAPPKDAVRIEELINYFSYAYPDPGVEHPFSVTTALGECPWNANHRLALVGLQARRIDRSRTPPRNLVFLIDVSGSMMDSSKLPLVKASLAMLAPNLTDRDRVAIVVYAGNTGLVLPSTRGGDTSTILDAVNRLQSSACCFATRSTKARRRSRTSDSSRKRSRATTRTAIAPSSSA